MKILVHRIGQLGDALVSVPAVRAVHSLYPEAQWVLLTDQKTDAESVSVDKVFEGCGLFDKVIHYRSKEGSLKGLINLAKTWFLLRRTHYDALVYLGPSQRTRFQAFRDRILLRSLGIKSAWGLSRSKRVQTKVRPLPTLQPEALFLVERLARDGLKIRMDELRFDLGIGDDEYAATRAKLGTAWPADGVRVFAVCPFTAMPAKKWPSSRYVEVFRLLHKKHGLRPLFLGSKADGLEAEDLINAVGVGYNLTGLSIRESAAAMHRCDFYLGNDTGTMHLASAEGLACVAIFSARTHPGLWEPSGPGHQVLRVTVPCEGCELTRCVEHGMLCLDLISVDAVYEACLRVFSEKKN